MGGGSTKGYLSSSVRDVWVHQTERLGSAALRSQVGLKLRAFRLRSIIPQRDESHKCITSRHSVVLCLTVFATDVAVC